MPFLTALEVRLLNDQAAMPWMTIAPLVFESAVTGETYTVPKYFRSDGASIPSALVAFPVVGSLLFLRYFGSGVFLGFKAGVLHDWLRRPDRDGNFPVPASVAHRIFREALAEAGYPEDVVSTMYSAVKLFNSK